MMIITQVQVSHSQVPDYQHNQNINILVFVFQDNENLQLPHSKNFSFYK